MSERSERVMDLQMAEPSPRGNGMSERSERVMDLQWRSRAREATA